MSGTEPVINQECMLVHEKLSLIHIYAEKRYLLQLSIAWYRVSVFLPERKDLAARLREEWLAGYRAYRENIKDAAKMTDRAALKIYRASPRMYGVIAGIFEKIFREV